MSFHGDFPQSAAILPTAPEAPGLAVLIVLPEGHDLFSLAILLDSLAAANAITGQPHFRCQIMAEVQAAQALALLQDGARQRTLALIADAEGQPAFSAALIKGLAGHWRGGGMVGAWGAGVFALAEAGLLTGRRFALPPDERARFGARWPGLSPAPQSFCQDGRVLTSVGRFILSDMVLHLIGDQCGRRAMVAVMDRCLIQRAPDEPHPVLDRADTHGPKVDPRMDQIDDWIDSNISRQFNVRDLAGTFGISPRQLERLFLRHLNRAPGAHLDHKRLSHAMHLIRQTDLSLEEIARSTGHGSRATFHKRFKRKFGISPAKA